LTEGPIRQLVNLTGTGAIVDVRDVDGRRMENVVGMDGDEWRRTGTTELGSFMHASERPSDRASERVRQSKVKQVSCQSVRQSAQRAEPPAEGDRKMKRVCRIL